VVSLSLSWQIPAWYLKLGHDRFLPHPYRFIIYLIILSLDGMHLETLVVSLCKPQINKFEAMSSSNDI
jgi:hypothetical protein